MDIERWHRRGPAVTARTAFGVLLALSVGVSAQGRISQETLSGAGLHYTLSLPGDGVAAPQGAPLVVSLHYGGPVSPWYGRGLLEQVVEPALRPLRAVMVAPDCPERAWLDCRQAVERIVDHVQTQHGTAPGCVILAGYSKGGIGSWALGALTPTRYAAAVVMAARAPDEAILSAWKTPVRVIHGARDELFALAPVEAAVDVLVDAGVDARLEILDGVTHYDTHRYPAPLARQVDWLRERCGQSPA